MNDMDFALYTKFLCRAGVINQRVAAEIVSALRKYDEKQEEVRGCLLDDFFNDGGVIGGMDHYGSID